MSTNNIENLVLQSNSDGGYDAFIIEYGFTVQEYDALDEQLLNGRTTHYTPIDFDTSDLGDDVFSRDGWACVELWVLTLVPNNEGNLVGDTELYVWEWVLDSSACTWTGGGSGSGSGSSSGSGDGSGSTGGSFGSGSGGGGSSGSSGVVSSPVKGMTNEDNPCSPRHPFDYDGDCSVTGEEWCQGKGYDDSVCDCVAAGESINLCYVKDCLGSSYDSQYENLAPEDKAAVYNYLNANCGDTGAQQFALAAIETLNPDWFNNFETGEVDWDDNTVRDKSFNSNQKAKCVYDKIKNLSGTVFNEIISSFDNSVNARVVFKIDNLTQPTPGMYDNARTQPIYNGNGGLRNFDIVIDEDFLDNASLIEIAYTIVHELVHAELMERCMQLDIITGAVTSSTGVVSVSFNNGAVVNTDLPSVLFAQMVALYSNYLGSTPNSSSNWQHDLFSVLNYRQEIAEDLEIFHPFLDDPEDPFENNLNNGTVLGLNMDEYFELFSWLGLESTSSYNNLTPLELTKINTVRSQTALFYNKDCN